MNLLDKFLTMSALSKGEVYSIVKPVIAEEIKYNYRVKYFPNNRIKITCFSKPIFNPFKAEVHKEEKPFESLREYDPVTGKMSYKFIEGKTIVDPFTGEIFPLEEYKEKKDREVRPDNIIAI